MLENKIIYLDNKSIKKNKEFIFNNFINRILYFLSGIGKLNINNLLIKYDYVEKEDICLGEASLICMETGKKYQVNITKIKDDKVFFQAENFSDFSKKSGIIQNNKLVGLIVVSTITNEIIKGVATIIGC